jgi:DNA-binding protein HU-beta
VSGVNKEDLSIALAVKFFITQVEAEKMLAHLLDGITKALQKNDRVYFRGFGSFTRERRKARRVRHPKTGKMMIIPAHYTVKFTPSAALRKKME